MDWVGWGGRGGGGGVCGCRSAGVFLFFFLAFRPPPFFVPVCRGGSVAARRFVYKVCAMGELGKGGGGVYGRAFSWFVLGEGAHSEI